MTGRSGVFITFEGGEGCGKSTQIHAFELFFSELGRDVVLVREPGGTMIGEKIRSILLDPTNAALCPRAELLLYEAARAQIVDEVINPALDAGRIVLCDRFFDSTLAYQGYGRGLSLNIINSINDVAVNDCYPIRTILLDIDVRVGLARATKAGGDRLEQEGIKFHQDVREGFLEIAALCPDRVRLVASDTPIQTACAVFEQMADLFCDIDPEYVRSVFESDPIRYFGEAT